MKSRLESLTRNIRTSARRCLPLFLLVPAMLAQGAQETLTNDAIVKMAQAHLSADVIVGQIRNNPGNYSLTTDSLIKLKQQGVPDEVIVAMQEKTRGTAASARNDETPRSGGGPTKTELSPDKLNQAPERPARVAEGVWEVNDVTDRMTGKSHVEGIMSQRTAGSQSSGRLQVIATCDDPGVNLLIAFLSDSDPKIGFKQNTYGTTIMPGGLLGLAVAATRHSKPWVEMRVKIDDNPPVAASSENDYANYATISFARNDTLFIAGAPVAKSAFAIEQLLKAHLVLVELTLENDVKQILEIKPQEPSFRKFASRCGGNALNARLPDTRMRDANGNLYEPGPPHSTTGFVFGSAATREARTYKGTAEGFANALPALIQRAVAASGLPPQNYDKEIAYIISVVRTCASITPQMAAGTLWYGQEVLWKLGEQYRVCQASALGASVSDKVRQYDHERERGLSMKLSSRSPRSRWSDGQGIIIYILFTPVKGDTGITLRNMDDAYGAVFAFIDAQPAGRE